MSQDLNQTPQAVRRHIAIFGRRNVGKSSLLNALTGQPAAIVSAQPGTTTDPVLRAMELLPLGPVVFIDTAGFDDEGMVGNLRNERTQRVVDQADMALLVTDGGGDLSQEREWLAVLQRREVPTVLVLNKVDIHDDAQSVASRLKSVLGLEPVLVSCVTGQGLAELRQAMARAAGDDVSMSLTGALAAKGDTVLLVMPQDPQAPKGRLILPQVQTIRDLLDKDCTVLCCTLEGLERSLAALREPPALIITDSQVFKAVYEKKPAQSRLTSFSVLMAALKGDVRVMAAGAAAIDRLTPQSRVLIAEACTHAPMSEDIGREKIPALIRKRVGESVQFDIRAGKDWPQDLTAYDLIIHCGACMFNRRLMQSRITRAQQQGVPITNYGLAIAHLNGILPQVELGG
ncbi:MAG: [Muribaculaceae bacterium]|nr:[FeFe] hydrogenase H-cluster maturation GTPase HydF [Muribaculaceae bacterium]